MNRLSHIARLAALVAVAVILAAAREPLSAGERAVILQALRGSDEQAEASLDDARLLAATERYAATELGQRLRPARIDRLWSIAPARRDVAAELDAARRESRLQAWLADLPPPYAAYRNLQGLRRRYAQLVDNGGWPLLGAGPRPRKGDRSAGVALLRRRLAIEDYAAGPDHDDYFGDDLEAALTRFQRGHGLDVDGVLGPATRAELDIPAQDRLAQIDANLERWRWLPRDMPDERVEVDVGFAEAVLIRRDEPVLRMRAVVGDPQHRTPMFASRLEAVILNPVWRVPASIASKEILPRAARDRGYLARNNFRFVEGRLEQASGPGNSLGRVKFDLPSPFGVYLHDTPSQAAFGRPRRALSHGCMRLEKPRELAAALLARQGVSRSEIDAGIEAGATRRILLAQPIALYVVYFTVSADDGGHGEFRPDLYGWDRKLTLALAGAAPRAALPRPDTDCAPA